MKKNPMPGRLVLPSVLVFFATAHAAYASAPSCAGADAETPVEKRAGEVVPQPHYGDVARRLADVLPACHVLNHDLDDSMSAVAWTNLFNSYDPGRCIFVQDDLDRFAQYRFAMDDAMRAGNVDPGFEVYRVYVSRLSRCMDFVSNVLETAKFEFPAGETYRIQRKDAPWPADEEALRELWRRRITNEVLAQTVSRYLDAKKDSSPPRDSREFLEQAAEGARTNLVKRYRQLSMLFAEPDEESVLQRYLNSVASAYDPHSDYLSPSLNEDFEQSMSLTLCGVGAELQMDEGALKIARIIPGGPLDRDKRIKSGDRIVGVGQGENGEVEDVLYRPMNKTIRKIRGPKGTKVTLEYIPRSDSSGAARRRAVITRDEIKLEDQAATGRVEVVECGGRKMKLGYIMLPSFYGTMDRSPSDPGYRSCADDVRKELAKLNSRGVEGLVLDLRGNGGGSLREAVSLVSVFVNGGPVVQVRESNHLGILRCQSGPGVFKKPVIVLIDRASASASEIVAAALQDYGRAIIAGDTRSHGKGTVQTVLPLGIDKFGTLKVTTARFYRINGSSTQVNGVESDIVLPSILDELDIGEDKLPGALPWTRVEPVPYRKAWNLDVYAGKLRKLSEARLAGSERWKRHIRAVHALRDAAKRVYVPLGWDERLKLMREERDAREETDGSVADLLLDTEMPDDGGEDVQETDEEEKPDAGADGGQDVRDGAENAGNPEKAEKSGDKDDPESSKPATRRRRRTTIPEKDDVVLQETFRILFDLVDCAIGRPMPEYTGLLDMFQRRVWE